MDCIDCHNRAAHTFVTAEEAINSAMADGAISPSLPFIHKEGLELLNGPYTSQDEARVQIPQQLEAFYRSQNPDVLAPERRRWCRRPARNSSSSTARMCSRS